MLYQLAHILRDEFPWLWNAVDTVNGWLFALRYGNRSEEIVRQCDKEIPYHIVAIRDCPTEDIITFFNRQPEEAYRFFHPHGFDSRSIERLKRNRAFLAYMLMDGDAYVGYFFLRSFFWGKCFRGRMVDIDWRGKGIGTMMNKEMNRIGFGLGMHIFETVSKDNVASYKSAVAASKCKIIREMANNDLYIEVINEN
jgi:IS1 family transposase